MTDETTHLETVIEVTALLGALTPDAAPPEPSGRQLDGESECLGATVTIGGEWEGTVELVCPRPLAVAVAARMFALSPDEIDDESLHDAVGELANIVGGALKSAVAAGTTLSLPSVARITDFVPSSDTAHFEWLGETMAVRFAPA